MAGNEKFPAPPPKKKIPAPLTGTYTFRRIPSSIKCGSVPRVERPDALLLADPKERVEHPSVAHLRVLGLTLDLQARLRQVDGKRACGKTPAVREMPCLLTHMQSQIYFKKHTAL